MTNRKTIVERAKARLLQGGMPRLEMSVIMALTAGTGFLVSFTLLRLGLKEMALRYPLAVLMAYGAFLLYLWAWLSYHRRQMYPREERDTSRTGDVSGLDLGDVRLPSWSSSGPSGGFAGRGGSFGGGGAGGRFETPQMAGIMGGSVPPPPAAPASDKGLGDVFSDLDLDDDAGKGLILLLLVVVILFLTGYLIYIAPGLLAEVLVDGVLVTGLYRHLKHEDRRHWLETALRKTWWYFLAVALLLMIGGALAQSWYPDARSIGDLWRIFMA